MTEPQLVLALANAHQPVRPAGARARTSPRPLVSAQAASAWLQPFLGRRVRSRELTDLRVLQRAVTSIVDALLDSAEPPLEALNQLAARQSGAYMLRREFDGRLVAALALEPAPAAVTLANDAILELGSLDPVRLRRCARPECPLVFYDSTRSGTRRWHSEHPCGLRERQRRHRDTLAGSDESRRPGPSTLQR